MDKSYSRRHPTIEQDQFDLNSALVGMLNCRRYLSSLGFQEIVKTDYDHSDINGIGGGYGNIVFPDGSEVDDNGFIKTSDRGSLIERMISKRVLFRSKDYGYNSSERKRAVRTSFGDQNYRFYLTCRDTTKEKAGWLMGLFKSLPEQFATEFFIRLQKQIISDQDLQEFEKYRQGLEDAMQHENLLTYSSQVPQRTRTTSKEVEVQHQKIDFVNPWEIEIPKIGGKKNE